MHSTRHKLNIAVKVVQFMCVLDSSIQISALSLLSPEKYDFNKKKLLCSSHADTHTEAHRQKAFAMSLLHHSTKPEM